MVIPSSSHVVIINMRFISKAFVLSTLILVLLSTTTYSLVLHQSFKNRVKSAIFTTKSFEVRPGAVVDKTMLNIELPRGHIAIKGFDAELVDEEGNSVPLYETYLHHYFTIKYFENRSMSHIHRNNNDLRGLIFKRNAGMCRDYLISHYWGFGADSRGTKSYIPDPFGVELGNPKKIPHGFEEKWMFNILAIDTRGVIDRKGCTECRCDLLNFPKDFYNVTMDLNGQPLSHNYKGGIFCCRDNLQCKLKEGFEGPMRRLALRYKIRWVDWDKYQVPIKVYILDSTDRVASNGSKAIHNCQVEYTISGHGNKDSLHVQKASIPMEKGGYLIYGTAHMHTGVINATLYGQDGKTLCTSTPRYGNVTEAGNEKGYAVEMSVCYSKPGSIKINDGETLALETRYENTFRTGAMGHFYIYLAEKLPHEDFKEIF